MKDRTKAGALHGSFAFEAIGWMEPEWVFPRLRRALALHVIDEVAKRSGVPAARVFDLLVKGGGASFTYETLPIHHAVLDILAGKSAEEISPSAAQHEPADARSQDQRD